ncbi:hypothetical protein GIB67_007189 [Kingdonia uniflora]|uniref:Auxin response factor n=1 Tax=Kingdonia uniflora TaxID=39325 RepID=A0A7J7NDS2_9MAGN|nr:hypothetical protein GIB67_007189 [Kingdonia uniflora]
MTSIDPKIWKVCAGTSVQIPTVGSTVYYFPQGHAEQSYSPPEFSSLTWFKPFIFCHIVSVNLLSNPETDEVFANIVLEPCDRYDSGTGGFYNEDDDILEYNDVEKIVSFAKILTPSDANNGGGFSVPRSCADSVFPTLDIVNEETPVQTITARDVQGVAWEFRHIYRGTPRRHLLTTGWSKFVNKKSLVAGDSVVFMKNSKGEIFTGIRRAGRSMRDLDWGRWNYQYAQSGVKLEEDSGFSRNCKGRVSPESVVEAVKLAVSGRAFEIVYYPNVESSDFVVKSERVENSLITHWNPGMRFKMAVETDDSSRTAWFQGSVSSAGLVDNGTADASPWRMLQESVKFLKENKQLKRLLKSISVEHTSLEKKFHENSTTLRELSEKLVKVESEKTILEFEYKKLFDNNKNLYDTIYKLEKDLHNSENKFKSFAHGFDSLGKLHSVGKPLGEKYGIGFDLSKPSKFKTLFVKSSTPPITHDRPLETIRCYYCGGTFHSHLTCIFRKNVHSQHSSSRERSDPKKDYHSSLSFHLHFRCVH